MRRQNKGKAGVAVTQAIVSQGLTTPGAKALARQWPCSDCTVPALWLWLQGRGEWVEKSRSRRPPWEEETDKATSLGPQEFQAPGPEQLS